MYQLIVLLPLIGALLAGLLGTPLPRAVRESVDIDPESVHVPAPGARTVTAHVDHAHEHHSAAWPGVVTSGLLVVTAILSWVAFLSSLGGTGTEKIALLPFIHSGELVADWSLRIDQLTKVMLVVVTTVSSLVHI